MSRLKLAGVFAVVLGGAVAGCANPADDKAVAEVSDAKEIPAETVVATEEGAEAAPVAAGEKVAINGAESTIGFVGSKIVGGSHDGGFKTFTGEFTLDRDATAVVAVESTIDMNSTWSDNEKLTGHLKNADFFEVETYPEAKFVSTEIKPSTAEGATHEVTGNLTLHGVTKSITFPAKVVLADEEVTFDSEFVLKRGDFKIVYGNVGDNAIRDEVVIKLALKGTRGESVPAPEPAAEEKPAG
jgi:polyisoprenoid-binding protein YceI